MLLNIETIQNYIKERPAESKNRSNRLIERNALGKRQINKLIAADNIIYVKSLVDEDEFILHYSCFSVHSGMPSGETERERERK